MKIMPVVIGVLLAWVMVLCTQTALAENIVERTVVISDVTQLQIEGDGSLELRIGANPTLKMTALKTQLDKVTVDAKGNVLRIRKNNRWGWFSEKSEITYQVTLTELQWLEVSGGMEVNVLSPINTDEFGFNMNGGSVVKFVDIRVKKTLKVELNGGSELNITSLVANDFEVHGNGAASITVAGKVHKQTLEFNGASQYNGFALESNVASVHSSGASAVEMWVSETLDIHLNGAGEVEYYGSPKVHSEIAGVSDVVRKGDVPPL